MSFAQALERLKLAVDARGSDRERTTVQKADLAWLITDWQRLDRKVREDGRFLKP